MYIILMMLPILFVASDVFADTVQFSYTEPTKTVEGKPLTALKEVTIYWKQDNGVEQIVRIPASAPTGGGQMSKTVTIANAPLCGSTTIVAQATASNTNATDFESVRTPQISKVKSNIPLSCSTPNEPSSLTLTIP